MDIPGGSIGDGCMLICTEKSVRKARKWSLNGYMIIIITIIVIFVLDILHRMITWQESHQGQHKLIMVIGHFCAITLHCRYDGENIRNEASPVRRLREQSERDDAVGGIERPSQSQLGRPREI